MKKLGRFVFPAALALMLGVSVTQWVTPAFAADEATRCGGAQAVPAGPRDYSDFNDRRAENCGSATAVPSGPHDYTFWSETRPDND